MPVQFAVIREGDTWRLYRSGEVLGAFNAKTEAVSSARALADRLSAAALAEVLIQSDVGELQPDLEHPSTRRSRAARWSGRQRVDPLHRPA